MASDPRHACSPGDMATIFWRVSHHLAERLQGCQSSLMPQPQMPPRALASHAGSYPQGSKAWLWRPVGGWSWGLHFKSCTRFRLAMYSCSCGLTKFLPYVTCTGVRIRKHTCTRSDAKLPTTSVPVHRQHAYGHMATHIYACFILYLCTRALKCHSFLQGARFCRAPT